MGMNHYEMLGIVIISHLFALSCSKQQLVTAPAIDNDWLLPEELGSMTENDRSLEAEPEQRFNTLDNESPAGLRPRKMNSRPIFEDMRLTPNVPNRPKKPVGNYRPRTVGNIVNLLNERLLSEIGGTDNLFFSPFSVSVALAKTYLGARGATAKEMEFALGYTRYLRTNTHSVHVMFEEKMHELENTSDEYKLLVANGLFLQVGYELRKEYVDDLKKLYESGTIAVDFARNGVAAMKEINQWSSNNTQGKIPALLERPLDPSTKLMLLNAIYFQGFWKFPFNAIQTMVWKFLKADGTKKEVEYMIQKRNFSYFSDEQLKYEFLSLPYKGNHISMYFILPYDRAEFPTIEVTSDLLRYVRQNLRRELVIVRIPKFQMSYERDLTNDLISLGLPSLFSKNGANLSGMRTQNDLYVSKVVHGARIDVNEEGTEAAAVTGVVTVTRTAESNLKTFNADHPFLFCILDKRSSTILFMGRVSDP